MGIVNCLSSNRFGITAKKLVLLLTFVAIFALLNACGEEASNESEDDQGGDGEQSDSEEAVASEETEASDYPENTIEIIVPYGAGGQTDTAARILAEHVDDYLGEDVDIVVVNQDGGGGAVAIDAVATDDSGGYKFLFHHDAMHTGYAIDQLNQTYEDLTPIGTYATANQAYVVSADSPWETLEEFVEDAKDKPGELVYGTDIGGTTHFMGGMLTQAADIELDMQDVGGESERMAALLGGHADMVVTSVGNAMDYEESGDYRTLATLTEERDQMAEDVPTATEQGYDIVFSVTQVLFGSPDIPDEITTAWNEATDALVEDEAYQEDIANVRMVHDEANNEEATRKHVEESFNYIQDLGEELGY